MKTNENNTEEEKGLYYTKKEPRKAFATFQRNQNKFYLNTLNLIDRKAAIMLRVNATILSAAVIFYNHISSIKSGVLIGGILIVFTFISLMFSVLASKPNSLRFHRRFNKDIKTKYPSTKENLFMVGMSSDKSLEEYEKAYNEVLKSQELQVGNQIRIMYLLEKEMKLGYTFLELAYTSFIVGFLVLICVFFFTVLL